MGEKTWLTRRTVRPPQHHVGDGAPLVDVADVILPHPEVVPLCTTSGDEDVLDELAKVRADEKRGDAPSGQHPRVRQRCVGEIDITEAALGAKSHHDPPTHPGPASKNPSRAPARAARARGQERHRRQTGTVLEQSALPCPTGAQGGRNRTDDRPRPDVHRYREYPKYGHGQRRYLEGQAGLADEAERLAQDRRAREKEVIFSSRRGVLRRCPPHRSMALSPSSAQEPFKVIRHYATPGARIGRRVHRRNVPALAYEPWRPAWSTVSPEGRRVSPVPGHGGGRSRTRRHPGHGAHRPSRSPCRPRSLAGDGGRGR